MVTSMNSSACLAALMLAALACSQVAAIGFLWDQNGLEAVVRAEQAALEKDAEEIFKISQKYLDIAQNLLKERQQTDDQFIGLGGKCVIVSHKVRAIEYLRRKVISETFKGPTLVEDLRRDLAAAHWRAYGGVESALTEIAMLGNSPPKVNFLPELIELEQMLVSRLQAAEKAARMEPAGAQTPRPRSNSIA